MSIKLALLLLFVTNIHGRPIPAPSELIAVNDGATLVDLNTINTVNTAAVVNSIVSGINVLLTWISFLIPHSKMRIRLAVLLHSFVLKMVILNNAFTTTPTSEVTLNLYRVGHLLADLGWVDLDLECSIILPGQ